MTPIRTHLATLLISLMLLATTHASVTFAATYYVSTSGSDSANGGSATPWRTIQHAANVMQAGDQVLIADGTYDGFYTTRNGSSGNPIAFIADGDNVVINTNNASTPDIINVEGHDYIEFEGLRVTGGSRSGIRIVEATGNVVRDCNVGPNQKWGIFTAYTPDIQLIDNVCFASVEQHGIYVSNSRVGDDNPVLRGNECYGNGQNGIQLNGDCYAGGDGIIQGAIIDGNLVHDNNWKGFSLISVQNSVIQNNIVFNNGQASAGAGGIHLADEPGCGNPSNDNVVMNNTIIEFVIVAMRLNNNAAGNTVFNNLTIASQVSRTIIDEDGGNSIDPVSNIRLTTTSGLFVDAANNNYRLLPTSQAVDAGAASYNGVDAPATDFEGSSRPSGAGYDVGGDEHAGGGSDTNPPLVSISAPLQGSTVSGSVTVSATASDDVGVAGVQFAVGGATFGPEDNTVPYQAVLNTASVADGPAVLTAQARDTSGNTATSTAVNVTVSNGTGSTGVKPDHPRLFYTPADISRIRALACYDDNGNVIPGCTPTQEWTQFKNWVDDGTTYYKPNAADYIMVHQVTEDDSYATTAINHGNGVIADFSRERSDSYLYVFGPAKDAAMVYDIYYDRLSPAERTNYINYMNQLMTELWNPSNNPYHTWSGWGTQQPGNNYWYSFMMATTYIALALYQENPTQLSLPYDGQTYTDVYDFMQAKLTGQMVPYLNGYGKGGGWHEGTNYRIGSYSHMFEMFMVLRNAGDTDYFTAIDFVKESLYWQLYILQPGFGVIYPGGDLARESSMSVSTFDREIMLLIAEGLKGSVESQYAQWWLDNVFTSVAGGWQFAYGLEFFLNQPLPSRDFRELPLGYRAEGLDFVNSRSSWNDDAVSVSFISTDWIESHQHKDQNSFVIYRDDWQAVDAATYSHTGIIQETHTQNSFLIDDYGQREGRGTGDITKYELTDDYSYVVGDATDAYYAGYKSQGAPALLSHFERELVHAFPNVVVVCDRITPVNSGSEVKYLFHSRYNPSISGNLITASQDDGKIFHRTLSPPANYNTIAEYHGTNGVLSSYRVEITPQSTTANHVWVSVMYLGPASMTSMPATELVSSENNNMLGAKVDVGGEDAVFMFSTDPGGAAPQSVIYEVGFAPRTDHNLMDLKPSTEYRVSTAMNGDNLVIHVSEGAGRMTSDQGVLRFTTGNHTRLASGGQAPPARR